MEVKQKAKELVEKCYSKYNNIRKDKVYSQEQKRMANLIVDEILNLGLLVSQPSINKNNNMKPNSSHKEYWQEVKREINNL
jgi:hypothetical protein